MRYDLTILFASSLVVSCLSHNHHRKGASILVSDGQLQKPPQNFLDLGVRVVSFCNFLKLAVRHSHLLQAVTDQVCGGEKGARV